ncbi:MAG: type pilus assembly protein PilC [Patescibacteria group bacterium]|nr:type pilus assembly protein PilC [Patescibacteria group bacterium]
MIFYYTAVSKDNIKQEGDLEALSQDAAVSELQSRGLSVIAIEQKKEEGFSMESINKLFKPKIKQKEMVIFSRQVATLFEAGVSALKGFRLLASEHENPTFKAELTGVSDDIEMGTSLSQSLHKRPDVFSPFFVNMVKSGEESGKLNDVFLFLADYMDREYELKQKTKKALTYPAFVVSTFFLIMSVMFIFVIPKMTALFLENGAELPMVTKIVIGISDFFVGYAGIIFPAIIIGLIAFNRYSKTEEGSYNVDKFKVEAPVIKNLFQKTFLARFADNMNTMLTSGIPIVRAIEITADVVESEYYRRMMLRVAGKVQTGTAFSKALSEEENLPNILIQMVRIGEETGELGYILKNLAVFYKREVENAIDSIIGLIEPAMIVGLGAAVAILVAAVLLPMYSLSDSIAYLDIILPLFT